MTLHRPGETNTPGNLPDWHTDPACYIPKIVQLYGEKSLPIEELSKFIPCENSDSFVRARI